MFNAQFKLYDNNIKTFFAFEIFLIKCLNRTCNLYNSNTRNTLKKYCFREIRGEFNQFNQHDRIRGYIKLDNLLRTVE